MIAEASMLRRAPSGKVDIFVMMMGPSVWGPRATHGGREAGGEAPSK